MKLVTFDCKMVVRSLIALLFVIAGISKLGFFAPEGVKALEAFKGFYTFLPSLFGLGSPENPLPALGLLLGLSVVFIEIVVAIFYALGIKKNETGWILIGFTILATVLVHNPWGKDALGNTVFSFDQLTQALKNLAIVAGIWATLDCICPSCKVKKGN